LKGELNFFSLVKLIKDLGFISIMRVFFYKASIKYRINRVLYIKAEFLDEDIFSVSREAKRNLPEVNSWINRNIKHSYLDIKISYEAPVWFYQAFTNKTSLKQNLHWSRIPDFDPELGDIKPLWDLSRFDWIIPLSQQASKGDREALAILNNWIRDWQKKNPPYNGVNWKCGQEASIRVIHLIVGAYILGQLDRPSQPFIQLIIAHLKRIEPTISYAIGQNNNHGTSEATALYIGGGFLEKNGHHIGIQWRTTGQLVLEKLVKKLIGNDGTFSQYSLNYHRLMLDTISYCEFFRRIFVFPAFSKIFYERSILATKWLFSIIDVDSGDGPNIGANDGARIIPLSNCSYRDYRPTVQLAMAIFKSELAYSSGAWNEQFKWLQIDIQDKKILQPKSLIADDGGFAILRNAEAFLCLRYPRFKFRPSQNDLLHLDLWVRGKNIFKDGGSFSYNADPKLVSYFGSICAHNSIQFDYHEPMDKISRFLYANWVKTDWISSYTELDKCKSYGVGYTDRFGSMHRRKVKLCNNCLDVTDEIQGFKSTATLRWRLSDNITDWQLSFIRNEIQLKSLINTLTISIKCSQEIISYSLEKGWESLYYLKFDEIPVIRLTVSKKCVISTTVNW